MKRQEMVFDPFQLLDKKDRKQLSRRNDRIGLSYLGTHVCAIGISGNQICYGRHPLHGADDVRPRHFARLPVRTRARVQPRHRLSHTLVERGRVLAGQPRLHHTAHLVSLPSRRPSHLYPDPGHGPGDGIAQPDDVAPLLRAAPRMAAVDDLSGRHHQARAGANASAGSWYVPKQDLPRIYNEARIMLVVYGGVAGRGHLFRQHRPAYLLDLPRILGEPLQRAWRIAEHKGCDEGPDVRTDTRSTKAGFFMRTLCWNMPFHSEHHVSPQVRFFALPKLNRLVGDAD